MGKYKIYVTDPTGAVIADISNRRLQLEYESTRNRSSKIQLSVSLDEMTRYLNKLDLDVNELFLVNINELHVYRHDVQIAAGQISYIQIDITSEKPSLSVYASGWLDILGQRVTGISQSYTATDLGAIMWDLIDTTQTISDLGITQGLIQTSRVGDRTYQYKNIKEALIQLSEVITGPDFEITPDKVFNVYSPKQGIRRDDITFTLPGNIIYIGYSQNGSGMANQIIANGAGEDYSISTTKNDAASQAVYKLRQGVIQYPDVTILTTLVEHADEELRTRTGLLTSPRITIDGNKFPEIGSYNLGDEVLIETTYYQKILAPILGYQRIDAINVKVSESDSELVELSLGES